MMNKQIREEATFGGDGYVYDIDCSDGFISSVSVQSLSRVRLFVTPWTAALQASLSIESVMTSNHLILCHPLLFLPSIFPSIRVFSNESALRMRWPIGVSASASVLPMNTQD